MSLALSSLPFSGSTSGRGVKIVATASAGTTIHTAHATASDEVWLWVQNNHSAALLVTIQFGGTTSPDDDIKMTVPAQSGPALVVAGLRLTGGLVVKAYAASANLCIAFGHVNRLT